MKFLKNYISFMESLNYEFGCVMLEIDVQNWSEILSKIDGNDLYKKDDDHYGKQKDPHITILYGLDPKISDEKVISIFREVKKEDFNIKTSDINLFENDDYDVLKIEIEDDLLNKYHRELKKLPNNSKFPEYNGHITIAYLKPGFGKKYVEKNPKIKLKIKDIVYSKPNGEKIKLGK